MRAHFRGKIAISLKLACLFSGRAYFRGVLIFGTLRYLPHKTFDYFYRIKSAYPLIYLVSPVQAICVKKQRVKANTPGTWEKQPWTPESLHHCILFMRRAIKLRLE